MKHFVLLSFVSLVSAYSSSRSASPRFQIQEPKHAVVELVPGASNVTGTLNLLAIRKIVNIQGIIYGLEEGFHGFHVHMKGELGNTCKDAGGHFNPDMNQHSSPNALKRHAGDLGNIYTFPSSPVTFVTIEDDIISLGDGGLRDIAGRAIVVHAGQDDLGRGVGDKAVESKKTGNAGARVACGIIKVVN